MLDQKQTKTRIAIYKPRGGDIEVEVKLERETMWIDAHQKSGDSAHLPAPSVIENKLKDLSGGK